MSRFNEVVKQAQIQSNMPTLQPVVEKELLHNEILRAMAQAGLLRQVTFIGGTCLRACYGSQRLSEDLDFTGGKHFSANDLRDLNAVVSKSIKDTYDLEVLISEPKRQDGPVSTWNFQIVTNIGSKHLPQQRIHVDICAVESYQRQPMVLRNHYGIELGTSGLIIQAESQHEILADKLLALALRPNRIKHRDIWDICWLVQRNQHSDRELILKKCGERGIKAEQFQAALRERLSSLNTLESSYRQEISRFLPQQQQPLLEQDGYWKYVVHTLDNVCSVIFA